MLRRRRADLKGNTVPAPIIYQLGAVGRATPTGANLIEVNRASVAAALVSIPNRYMHSPVEMTSLEDIDHAADLLARFSGGVGRRRGIYPAERHIPPTVDFCPTLPEINFLSVFWPFYTTNNVHCFCYRNGGIFYHTGKNAEKTSVYTSSGGTYIVEDRGVREN
jgi:hypothetical protein